MAQNQGGSGGNTGGSQGRGGSGGQGDSSNRSAAGNNPANKNNPAGNLSHDDRVKGGENSAQAQERDEYGQFAGTPARTNTGSTGSSAPGRTSGDIGGKHGSGNTGSGGTSGSGNTGRGSTGGGSDR